MTQIDLAPAGLRMAALVAAVPEELLGAPTPCPAYCVGDLLDHIAGLGTAFSAAARKDAGADSEPAPPGDRSRLSDDWRSDIAAGQQPQFVVPPGHWQRARPVADEPCLVSCVVVPGFDFADFFDEMFGEFMAVVLAAQKGNKIATAYRVPVDAAFEEK